MPRVVDHVEQRRRIAHATWAVIGREGLSGTTVREIAREAQCTTGLLSHYFTNQRQLIRFAFELVIDDLCLAVESAAPDLAPGLDRLAFLIDQFLPQQPEGTDPRTAVTMSSWAFSAADPDFASQHRANYGRLRTLASQFAREAIASGQVAGDSDPDDIGDSVVSFADGLAVGSLLDPDRFPLDRRERLVSSFLRQLSSTAEPAPE